MATMATNSKAILATDGLAASGHNGQMTSRLQEVLDIRGMKAADLARLTETQPSTLSKLTTGKRQLSRDWAVKLAPHLGVDPMALLAEPGTPVTGDATESLLVQPRPPSTRPVPPGHVLIREYQAEAAAGEGGVVILDHTAPIVGEWVMPRDALPPEHRGSTVVVMRVVGDSMTPLLRPNDRVMVDIGHNHVGADGTYLAWNGLVQVFKRLQVLPGTPPMVRFSSENPAYTPYQLPLDEVRVLGRVLGKWTWL
jgi:hypothetical protein